MRFSLKRKLLKAAIIASFSFGSIFAILAVVGQFCPLSSYEPGKHMFLINEQGFAMCWFRYTRLSRIEREAPWLDMPGYKTYFILPRIRIDGVFDQRLGVRYTAFSAPHWFNILVMSGLFLVIYLFRCRYTDGFERCMNCGYIIEGIESGKCSECGEKIAQVSL